MRRRGWDGVLSGALGGIGDGACRTRWGASAVGRCVGSFGSSSGGSRASCSQTPVAVDRAWLARDIASGIVSLDRLQRAIWRRNDMAAAAAAATPPPAAPAACAAGGRRGARVALWGSRLVLVVRIFESTRVRRLVGALCELRVLTTGAIRFFGLRKLGIDHPLGLSFPLFVPEAAADPPQSAAPVTFAACIRGRIAALASSRDCARPTPSAAWALADDQEGAGFVEDGSADFGRLALELIGLLLPVCSCFAVLAVGCKASTVVASLTISWLPLILTAMLFDLASNFFRVEIVIVRVVEGSRLD